MTLNIAVVIVSFVIGTMVQPIHVGMRSPNDDSETRFRTWCHDSCAHLIEMLELSCNDPRIRCRCSSEIISDSTQLSIAKNINFVVTSLTAYKDIPDVNMVLGVLEDYGWPVSVGDTVCYVLSTVYLPSPVPELQYEVFQRVQELSVRNAAFIIEHDIVRARLADTRVIDRKP